MGIFSQLPWLRLTLYIGGSEHGHKIHILPQKLLKGHIMPNKTNQDSVYLHYHNEWKREEGIMMINGFCHKQCQMTDIVANSDCKYH